MRGRTPLDPALFTDEEELKQYVSERCCDFHDRYGVQPDALVAHPTEPFILRVATLRGMTVVWEGFCPRGEVYPVHLESLQMIHTRHLERQLMEAGAELELWKARQK